MSKQTINIGASPNDGTGTPLRTSFDYTNQNFTELYTALGGGVGLPGATTQVIFNDGGTNLAGDAGLVYNKTTDALTVAGLVTAGSATITGALTVDTATLVVDPTNDRVGIGTTTPAYKLEVATGTSGQQALASFRTADTTAANNAGIQIYATPSSTAASRSVLLSLDADGADASGGDYFIIQKLGNSGQVDLTQQSNAAMTFSTNGTERARITASGDVNITTGNVVMTTSGKGIDFSAVTGGTGTATANVLNDYEEGTWVPVQGAGLTVVGTFSSSGTYTKVGRLVTITGILNGSTSIATSAIGLMCLGLPFTASVQVVGGAVNQSTTVGANCIVNVTDFYSITAIAATNSIRFSATYPV